MVISGVDLRRVDRHSYIMESGNIVMAMDSLGCGSGRVCVVGYAGEVFVAKLASNTVLIQIPGKTQRLIIDEIGCGRAYLCTVDSAAVTVIKKHQR
jgi:hypothetical protein